MYTVCFFDESTMDDAVLFSGSVCLRHELRRLPLAECLSYVDGDAEMYIVEPDGFTVYAA